MKEFEIKVTAKECSYDELNDIQRKLVDEAKSATFRAYAPFSGYQVGAAILLDNGKIVSGSNQENAAYPSGLCAERTTAFYAASANPGVAFRKIAIAASPTLQNEETTVSGFQRKPVSPCGGCRQALMQYEHIYGPIEILLYGSDKIYILPSVSSLLPYSFTDF